MSATTAARPKRRRNRDRPRRAPLGVGIANLDEASGLGSEHAHDVVRRTLRSLDQPLNGHLAAAGLVEAAAWVGDGLPDGWRSVHDRSSLDRAGVAQVYDTRRLELLRHRYRRGVAPYIRGRRIGMRTRWILTCTYRDQITGRRRRIRTHHNPPKRYSPLWPAMGSALARFRVDVDLADWNSGAGRVKKLLGGKVRWDGVMGIRVRPGIPTSGAVPVDVGAGHDSLGTVLWPDADDDREYSISDEGRAPR